MTEKYTFKETLEFLEKQAMNRVLKKILVAWIGGIFLGMAILETIENDFSHKMPQVCHNGEKNNVA